MEFNGQLQFKIKLFCFLKRKIYCHKKEKKTAMKSSKQLLWSTVRCSPTFILPFIYNHFS